MQASSQAAKRYARNSPGQPTSQEREERQQLVERYGTLVRRVARRIMRRLPPYAHGVEEEDLVSVGLMGLLDAHERFDPQNGVSFEVFAEFRVKGTILDELRRQDFFPRRLRQKANHVQAVRERLQAEFQRAPSEAELAEALGMTSEELAILQNDIQPYELVDDHDVCVTLHSPEPSAFHIVQARELREQLGIALRALPEREQLVLDLFFNHELTGREIAQILEISEGRVSQIKSAALRVLRDAMELA